MRLPTKEKVTIWLSNRETQAKLMVLAVYISIGMMVLGYIIMAYIFFVIKHWTHRPHSPGTKGLLVLLVCVPELSFPLAMKAAAIVPVRVRLRTAVGSIFLYL